MAFSILNSLKSAARSDYSHLAKDAEAANNDFLNQSLLRDRDDLDDTKSRSKHVQNGTSLTKRLAIPIWTCISTLAFLVGIYWRLNAKNICTQLDSFWTPVWNDVDPAYHLVRFNGTLDAESEFRGPPSAAVDAAWSRLDDCEYPIFLHM